MHDKDRISIDPPHEDCIRHICASNARIVLMFELSPLLYRCGPMVQKRKNQNVKQNVDSNHGPLGYGPSALPLRHPASIKFCITYTNAH